MLRLQPEQLAALDRWIAAQPEPKLSRPEAIRRLLTAALGQDDVLLTAYREIVELNLADAEAANEEDWIEPLRAELQNPPDFQDLWGWFGNAVIERLEAQDRQKRKRRK